MVAIDTVVRWLVGWVRENSPLWDAWSTEAEFQDSRALFVAMEDTMSDLYAINLHVQERLERDWREEVRATEAARWLDEAGLLRNYKNGLPLRRLLSAGRIAGQQQLHDQANGSWWIRRLAKSRDAMAIQEARQRILRYLPIDRSVLHDDWPVSGNYPAFWLELGKTVAAFGNLESELTSACYALTAPPADFGDPQPDQIEAHLKWYAKVEGYRADAMFALVKRFDELLWKDGRVPHTVRTDLRRRLDELRTWRNALCHGAWFGFSGDAAGHLSHYSREGERVVQFPPIVTLQNLADLRGRIVDATIRVVETSSVAGSVSAHAVVLPRQFEPRNHEPEQQ